MSPLGMWLRPRLFGLAVLAAVVALAVGVMLTATGRLKAPEPRATPVAGTSGADASPAAPGADVTRTPDVAAVAAARDVGRAFAETVAPYRYDDAPDALRRRLRPLDSDRLDGQLAQGGGPGTGGQALAARHEVASASVQRITSQGLAPDGRLVLVAVVAQAVRWDGGRAVRQRYLELFLVPTPAGWRVDEVSW